MFELFTEIEPKTPNMTPARSGSTPSGGEMAVLAPPLTTPVAPTSLSTALGVAHALGQNEICSANVGGWEKLDAAYIERIKQIEAGSSSSRRRPNPPIRRSVEPSAGVSTMSTSGPSSTPSRSRRSSAALTRRSTRRRPLRSPPSSGELHGRLRGCARGRIRSAGPEAEDPRRAWRDLR